jgi:predicted TIM-barrel fold metal-dependent hydrolase
VIAATVTRRTMLARSLQAAGAMAAFAHTDADFAAAEPKRPMDGLQIRPTTDAAIWDVHVHLTGVTGTIEERVDRLLEFADRLGIERLVMHLGTASSPNDPSPDQVRKANDEVLRAMAHAPARVLGFVYLNPKHVQESLREMDRCVRDGPMVGVKLWVAIECSRPELDPIVRRAVELKVLILQHAYNRTGPNLPGESSPADVAILAARHPDANFICAHTGNDWERGIRAIRATKNVWSDVSGSDPTAGFVEMAVRELGAERIVFASDAGGRSFASQLAKVTSADLPNDQRRMILGGNLRGLLRPILAAKGMKA